MHARRLWVLVVFVCLLPREAHAHRHRAGVFIVPRSKLLSSDYSGFLVSGSWPVLREKELSWIANFARYSGSEDEGDFVLLAYSGGLQYRQKLSQKEKWFLIGQVWGGAVDAIEKLQGDTSRHRRHFIAGVGPGVELMVSDRFSFRLQADLVHRFNGRTGFAISLGVGLRGRDLTDCAKCP